MCRLASIKGEGESEGEVQVRYVLSPILRVQRSAGGSEWSREMSFSSTVSRNEHYESLCPDSPNELYLVSRPLNFIRVYYPLLLVEV